MFKCNNPSRSGDITMDYKKSCQKSILYAAFNGQINDLQVSSAFLISSKLVARTT